MPTSLTLRVSLLEGHLGLTGQVWLREKISNVICLSKRPSEKTMSPSWLFQEKQMKEALREAKTKHQALIEEKAIPKRCMCSCQPLCSTEGEFLQTSHGRAATAAKR